jgi:hypothetical protein
LAAVAGDPEDAMPSRSELIDDMIAMTPEWRGETLAGPGEDRQRFRGTLRVFLEEGRALALLPVALDRSRIDVALALRYLDWVGGT